MSLVSQVLQARHLCEKQIKASLQEYLDTTGFKPLEAEFQIVEKTHIESEHKEWAVGDVHIRSET